MFRISSVTIEGFWGKYRASTDFHSDVNIFIGRNGTGKTTFMNLLQAVLHVDLRLLTALEFQSVIVRLRDKSRRRTIHVTKQESPDLAVETVLFRVGQKSYPLPLTARDIELSRPVPRNYRVRAQYEELRRAIEELVNVSSLSVHREAFEISYEEEYPSRSRSPQRPIDQRLEALMQQLTRYQLTLAENANKVSADFQRQVLASVLYDQHFDAIELTSIAKVELGKEKDALSTAYEELGALDKGIAKRIEAHIKALNRSLTAVREWNVTKSSKGLAIEDIMPLPLLRRTQHIIDLSREAQKAKQEIFQPIEQFVAIVKEFMQDKDLSISPTTGELSITKEDKKIGNAELSSGEKQLLILLTETLLQKSQMFIFLADEPELSLHIEWQAKVISSIRQLNANSQIIVATHSPEIAGGWSKNIIDMEDIVCG